MKITKSLSLALAVWLVTGTVAADKIVWKPVKEVLLRVNERAPRKWNVYESD
jgi:hypothetical protein